MYITNVICCLDYILKKAMHTDLNSGFIPFSANR